eukprot:scaffold34608_cov172-Amphora_coffeaeformis.AAC.10
MTTSAELRRDWRLRKSKKRIAHCTNMRSSKSAAQRKQNGNPQNCTGSIARIAEEPQHHKISPAQSINQPQDQPTK